MPKISQTRADRLAAALRQNLKRRKAGAKTGRAPLETDAAKTPPPRPNSDKKAG